MFVAKGSGSAISSPLFLPPVGRGLGCFGGVMDYLEVQNSNQQLFQIQLILAQSRTNEFLAVISLYRALGGI